MNNIKLIICLMCFLEVTSCASYSSLSEVSSSQLTHKVTNSYVQASAGPLTELPDPTAVKNLNDVKPQSWFEPRISDEKMGYLAKCIRIPAGERLKAYSLVQITSERSLSTLIRFGYYLAVETTASDGKSNYSLQIMLLNRQTCSLGYVSTGIGQNPINEDPSGSPPSEHAYRDYARSTKYAWYKWRLKHVPGERQKVQTYLDSGSPRLADEEYWSFSKLGYRMPKHYQLIQ